MYLVIKRQDIYFFLAQNCSTVKEWIEFIHSRRDEVLERCGSPGLNPIPLGQYPIVNQSFIDSDQIPIPKPKKVKQSV